MSEEETISSTPTSPEPGPVDVVQAVWQLRLLVCGLGVALLVLSLAFNAFVWKQNRNIKAMTQARLNQAVQLDSRVKQLTIVANELGTYSAGKPELVSIFSKYGVQLKAAAPATQP